MVCPKILCPWLYKLFSGLGVKGFGDKSLGAGDQILGIENSFSVLLNWFVLNFFVLGFLGIFTGFVVSGLG